MSVPLVRTLVLYFAVICAVRLMGKRQLGEMDPAELVVTILVSDLAAVPMQDLGIPLFFGLVPIAALVTLEVLLSILSRSRAVSSAVCSTDSLPSSSARDSSTCPSCASCGSRPRIWSWRCASRASPRSATRNTA